MAVVYLTFNQKARLFGWLQKNRNLCRQVTGHDPVECVAIPFSNRDIGGLTYTRADFPPPVQWWMDKRCPYPFVKSGKRKRYPIILIIKDWYYKQKNNINESG